ncbi:gamma-glutamyltransferase [Arthrobacter rhombi]|uniref:gamma-glutamyltransferase n=1 Tax=Arthrobacter rhombi TaxID=71253 RepID=UPI003FD2E594
MMAGSAAVSSPHELATSAGVDILRRGGSAVDAMVATNAALGVLYPHMTGAGGDAFWVIHDAKSGSQHVLNASGRAGKEATREKYSGNSIDPRGAMAALTVPGAVDGWCQANKRFGRLPLSDCLGSAIDYAHNGFPVSSSLAKFSASSVELLKSHPRTAETYLRNGTTPFDKGETMKNLDLATTLETIASEGRNAFYEGSIAREIGNFLSRHGGVLDADDFGAHESNWMDPIRARYRGRVAIAPPPNSEGMATLAILGILEHVDVAALKEDPAGYVDVMTRATALAFQDRDKYLDDPAFGEVPVDRLLDPAYLAQKAKALEEKWVASPERLPAGRGDTTFSCAVDDQGNVAAVIQSLYWEWGSGLVAGDTGILLQNRGAFFSLDPHNRDRLEPRKRPASTLTNGMLLSDNKPELVFGAMGGEGEPQTQAAIVTRVIDHALSVQEAIDAPRWLLGRTWGEQKRGLRLEGRFDPHMAKVLEDKGHENVSMVDDYDDVMGHAQAIHLLPNRLDAGSDPRSDGAAMGY